jgi:hypothetical protein
MIQHINFPRSLQKIQRRTRIFFSKLRLVGIDWTVQQVVLSSKLRLVGIDWTVQQVVLSENNEESTASYF